jgi:DNA-directed RNA polymerase subunit RPC12/RpoP
LGTVLKCPRCGSDVSAPLKEWSYAAFRVKKHYCAKCKKNFMAYYTKDGKFSHTIPKSG